MDYVRWCLAAWGSAVVLATTTALVAVGLTPGAGPGEVAHIVAFYGLRALPLVLLGGLITFGARAALRRMTRLPTWAFRLLRFAIAMATGLVLMAVVTPEVKAFAVIGLVAAGVGELAIAWSAEHRPDHSRSPAGG